MNAVNADAECKNGMIQLKAIPRLGSGFKKKKQ